MLKGLREIGWKNVTKCFALFPTVEKMSKTPQGSRLRLILRFFDYFNFLTCFIMFLFELLPHSLKKTILKNFFNNSLNHSKKNIIPECVIDSSVELIRINVVRNIIHMSNHELNTVNFVIYC